MTRDEHIRRVNQVLGWISENIDDICKHRDENKPNWCLTIAIRLASNATLLSEYCDDWCFDQRNLYYEKGVE